MLFDKETRYWQEEYRKGNLDDEDMCGETRALLDGSAEKSLFFMLKVLGTSVTACLLLFIVMANWPLLN